ncbi:hypothetical protein AN958_06417, partial [Leucoagaricus sp. SymC.cos]
NPRSRSYLEILDVPFPISSDEVTKAMADSGLPINLAAKPRVMWNFNASDTATICVNSSPSETLDASFNQQKLGLVLLNANVVGIGGTLLSPVVRKQSGVPAALDLIWSSIIVNMQAAVKAMPKLPLPFLPLWTALLAPMFLLVPIAVQNMLLTIINANSGVIVLTLDGSNTAYMAR